MIYYYVRMFLKWFCKVSGQQCSGKRTNGYATEWCQHRAFHDGPCIAYTGEEFSAMGEA